MKLVIYLLMYYICNIYNNHTVNILNVFHFMKKNPDKEFIKQLEEAKEKLPHYYGVLVRAKYPHISKNKLYNVMNEGVEDWCVLEALKDIAGLKKEVA